MKFTITKLVGKNGAQVRSPEPFTAELAIDRDGRAWAFDDIEAGKFLEDMKETKLIWLEADGFLLRGLESTGFDRYVRERWAYQEWYVRSPEAKT